MSLLFYTVLGFESATPRTLSRALRDTLSSPPSCNEVSDFASLVAKEKASNKKIVLLFEDAISPRIWNVQNTMSGGGN
eukprot:6634752-Prymnesium_polylepis.3